VRRQCWKKHGQNRNAQLLCDNWKRTVSRYQIILIKVVVAPAIWLVVFVKLTFRIVSYLMHKISIGQVMRRFLRPLPVMFKDVFVLWLLVLALLDCLPPRYLRFPTVRASFSYARRVYVCTYSLSLFPHFDDHGHHYTSS
jgi:hypothetical protein